MMIVLREILKFEHRGAIPDGPSPGSNWKASLDAANHRRWSGFWARELFDQCGDEIDRQEADKKRAEFAAQLGADGALAARERADGDASDILSGLQVAATEPASAGYFKEFALSGSGTERGDFHAEFRDFSGDAERKEAVECLGGRISGEIRDRLKAGAGGNDEHPAATPLDHARNEEMREADYGFAVDADHGGFLIGVAGGECAELTEAGVVDEDVDDEAGFLSGGEDLLRSGWVVEVGNDDSRVDMPSGEFGGEGLEAIAATRGEDEFCAACSQLAREGGTDSGAGPGD